MDSTTTRHSCLKLEITTKSGEAEFLFIKGTWYPSRFDVSITNGSEAWILNAAEDEVSERADQWDQPISEYIDLAERHLGFQQPESVYGFTDAGNGHKRLSWTFEREGTKLEWRWKCKPSPDNKKATSEILDFLLEANIRLSDEVVKRNRSFEQLKVETEKSLMQSERFCNEKTEFETEIYAKFLQILNSKKAKLRQLSRKQSSGKALQGKEEESSDATETFDGESDAEKSDKSF